MIRGVHTMYYSDDPEATRAFIRDVSGFDRFTDVGEGWLIFDLPEADMGIHPADASGEFGEAANTHDVSFYCDDIEATVSELSAKGVTFTEPVSDQGFGLVTRFDMPGGLNVQLYQPHYGKG